MLSLHQAIKRMPLNREETTVLKVVRDGLFLPLERISQISKINKGKVLVILRRLQEGLYVYKDKRGRYIPVEDSTLDFQKALDRFLTNTLKGMGPVRVEDLYLVLKKAIDVTELSNSLERLWDQQLVNCSFLLKNSPDLYWYIPQETKDAKGWSVVSPHDRIYDFFHAHLHLDDDEKPYLVFKEGRFTGRFDGKISGKRLIPTNIEGGQDVFKAGRDFAHRVGLAWGNEVQRTEDWEVLDWWERTRGSAQ